LALVQFLLFVFPPIFFRSYRVAKQNYKRLGVACVKGDAGFFVHAFPEQVKKFKLGLMTCPSVIFEIGRVLRGHVHELEKRIFHVTYQFEYAVRPANQAIQFFEFELRAVRKAVDAWTLVGLRCHVVRDIRVFIARMIWEARNEAVYKIDYVLM
jgi:hypothetical protein